jgi:ferric-dicitrate binding protein FerR (iron transport regulator)
MDKKELTALVRKYLKGKASAGERIFVEAWYREMDSSQPISAILSPDEMEQLEQQMFQNISGRINVSAAPVHPSVPAQTASPQAAPLHPSAPAQAPVRRLFPARRAPRYVAAAAILIFITSGVYILFQLFGSHPPSLTNLSSPAGKVSKTVLADGTQVWLNADSRLKFAGNFGKSGPREVFLEGEAYFEVAKDEQHPFLVRTHDLTTHVLGTKFNVRAYAGLSNIEVTLLEGKVMLSAPSASAGKEDTLYLEPNQKALFAAIGANAGLHRTVSSAAPGTAAASASQTPSSTGTYRNLTAVLTRQAADHAIESAAWRNGVLIFREMPLGDVITSLGHRYNIHIHSDSSLLNSPVTATIRNNLSPDEALLEITRQLRRVYSKGQARSGDQVQFRQEDSIYYIE